MKLFNQLFNNKFSYFDQMSIFLFSMLPISIFIGNAAININILLISLLFLSYCFQFKQWDWVKKDIFLYLLALYIFLNLNSLYSYFILYKNPDNLFWYDAGIRRSFLFIKFILMVFAFSTLLKDNKILNLVHKSWIIIITITILDVFYEKFIGHNILGYNNPDLTRIVSFFKDESVVGSFIFCFGYTATTYFMSKNNKKKTFLPLLLIFILIPLSVFITGEKSSFIKSIILFFLILYFFRKNEYNLNYKILIGSLIFLISSIFILNENTRIKYTETYKRIKITGPQTKIMNKLQNIKYFAHYDSAIRIFKNYPVTGVGNKNFRIECYNHEKYFNKKIKFSHMRCNTNPHQIHFEILSEQGIVGYSMILFFLIWFSIKNIKMSIKNKNMYHLSNTGYLLVFFIPLLPGGGMFSTFNGVLFWVIFSLVNLSYEKK